MKVLMVIWLLSAGIGVSYSVIIERKKQTEYLRSMENNLKRLAYYMCEWRMPVEEAIEKMLKEELKFGSFYKAIHKKILERNVNDFGELWQEESKILLADILFGEDIKTLWQDCFFHIPMEPEAVKRQLLLKSELFFEKRKELEEKYKGEHRVVLSMGFFASAFLCLILW